MFTAKKVYAMLENESLWDAATQCHEILAAAKIPDAVMGGVAVCLHGYQRNTVDVDLLVRSDDSTAIRESLEQESFACSDRVARSNLRKTTEPSSRNKGFRT